MIKSTRNARVQISVALLAIIPGTLAADWPHWRGPNYDGVSPEKDFKRAFESLPKVWEHAVGSGYSGISVAGGRAYTCGVENDQQTLFCFEADTGKVVWKAAFEENYKDQWGDGTRGTPTIADGKVYIMGARGTVSCHDAGTGKKVWSRKYENQPQWGFSGSVLVRGELAIVATGGKGGAVRGLDRNLGTEVWTCGSDDDSGYSTPYPFTFNSVEYVCAFLGNGAVVADIKTGKEVLRIPWKTDWKVNAATPIFHDGHLWLGSGYSTGCGVYKLSVQNGALAAKELWQSTVMLNKFQTPVLFEGHLYAFDERAFKCVNFMNGEQKWKLRGENGTVVLADGHLIALSEKGELFVGQASPAEFKHTGRATILDDRCWTVPTVINGKVYARNLERVVCFDISK